MIPLQKPVYNSNRFWGFTYARAFLPGSRAFLPQHPGKNTRQTSFQKARKISLYQHSEFNFIFAHNTGDM